MLLENLTAYFPGATTLKYRVPGTNAIRILKCAVRFYIQYR
jgi:Transactive response DNA-binding protein N-terminal domain